LGISEKQVKLVFARAGRRRIPNGMLVELIHRAAGSHDDRPLLHGETHARTWIEENLPSFQMSIVDGILELIEENDCRSETEKARLAHKRHMRDRRYYD